MCDPTVLYVNSFNRSGSTLLGMLLVRQSSITFVGEMRNLHEHILGGKVCYCGCSLDRCPFWSSVIKKAGLGVKKCETKTEANVAHKIVKRACVFNFSVRVLQGCKLLSKSIGKEFEVTENILDIALCQRCAIPLRFATRLS